MTATATATAKANTRELAIAFIAGLVFAIGLGVSGMTQPSKVIGFLDLLGGHWDPSLAFVMIGAIGVHLPLYRLFRARGGAPVQVVGSCGPIEAPNAPERVERKLLAGAGIFGIGWGLGGYCPGPALVSLASGGTGVFVFVAAMVVGMWLLPTESSEVAVPSGARSQPAA